MPGQDIAEQLNAVRARIDAAAAAAGRPASDIALIAVSKTFPAERVREAAAAGQRAFGENRVQEGVEKADVLRELALEWHLIGHLQSNKAKKAVAAFDWIHSIDSIELLRKVDAAAVDFGVQPKILIQVDLAHETTKHGADVTNLSGLIDVALEARAVRLRGLMIVPPFPDNAEDSRPWFRQLRDLRDGLVARGTPASALAELSMGMSHDLEVAVQEGATMVRVGTAIFGRRTPAPVA